jgi:DNA-binding NarL/FixJ family response regulator
LSELEQVCAHGSAIASPYNRTVIICDANPVLSDGIRMILKDNEFLSRLTIIADGKPDLVALRALAPDILIIDPWQCAETREEVPNAFLGLANVTSLIGYCNDISPTEARGLSLVGFRGIMPKTVQREELVRIVCAVAFGGVYLHESYTNNRAGTAMLLAPGDDAQTDLTDREIEVLRHVALGSSMKEIGTLLQISTKTVDTYKNRANRKLNLRSRADIVRYAIKSGWMH